MKIINKNVFITMKKEIVNSPNENSIFVLYPKRSSFGIWSFDDPTKNLVSEPFVGVTNLVIDRMAEESGYDLKDDPQIAIFFSATEFPDSQCSLVLQSTSPSGSTYREDKSGLLPWLCPAFFKYFPEAPISLYGFVKKKL
jgi:hypothetical protein